MKWVMYRLVGGKDVGVRFSLIWRRQKIHGKTRFVTSASQLFVSTRIQMTSFKEKKKKKEKEKINKQNPMQGRNRTTSQSN